MRSYTYNLRSLLRPLAFALSLALLPFALALIGMEGSGMMIASRNGMVVSGEGGAWTNPYVTDGLIGLWDGEWNSGNGEHSSTVGAVNLAGNAEIDFPSNVSYWSMGAKSFDLSLVYHTDVRGYISIAANTFDMAQFTTEICMSRGSDSTGEFGLVQDGVSFLTELNGATTALFRAYNSGGGLTINAQPNVGDTTSPKTLTFTYDGTTARFYVNGTQSTSSAMVLRAALNAGLVRIGSVYLYNSGSIYDIRIYNKALTAESVAANAAVDASRFGVTLAS